MRNKLDRLKIMLEKIKKDCKDLKKKGELTERGKGQLDMVTLIEEELKK